MSIQPLFALHPLENWPKPALSDDDACLDHFVPARLAVPAIPFVS